MSVPIAEEQIVYSLWSEGGGARKETLGGVFQQLRQPRLKDTRTNFNVILYIYDALTTMYIYIYAS
jgi:hypothetical protein